MLPDHVLVNGIKIVDGDLSKVFAEVRDIHLQIELAPHCRAYVDTNGGKIEAIIMDYQNGTPIWEREIPATAFDGRVGKLVVETLGLPIREDHTSAMTVLTNPPEKVTFVKWRLCDKSLALSPFSTRH